MWATSRSGLVGPRQKAEATLRYFAGELAAAEVLRHSEVLDGSGTGIVGLAQSYVEADGDANAVAEIERLLDLLLIPDHRATSTAAEASAPGPRVRPIGYRASQEAAKSCIFPYPDLGNPCFRSVRVGSEQFGSKYIFWIPDIAEGEEWQGWTRGPSTIRDAILASAVQLESMSGSMPAVAVWLAPYAGHSIVNLSGGLCGIQLNKGAQALRDRDPKLLQQAVASAIARCYVRWNFGLTGGWRNAIAWYLSDVIYPDASMEVLVLEVPNALAGEELGSTHVSERASRPRATVEEGRWKMRTAGLLACAVLIVLTAACGEDGSAGSVAGVPEPGEDENGWRVFGAADIGTLEAAWSVGRATTASPYVEAT